MHDRGLRCRSRHPRLSDFNRTAENQFVVAVIELASNIIELFRKAVRRKNHPATQRLLVESESLLGVVSRWRRHPALADVASARRFSIESTVLRGRPGYREITRFFVDLGARTRMLDPKDARRLLEERDAALIYEYWCFFQVLDTVSEITGCAPGPIKFRYETLGATLRRSTRVDFGAVRVWFNREFRPPKRSYSVPLRPDIALEFVPEGSLHLFDAKLKRESVSQAWSHEADVDSEENDERATYRRGDLYKMHTYRDALGAQSVWILFPGRGVETARFEPEELGERNGPSGVGAIPLVPGDAATREKLRSVIREMIAATVLR